MIRTLLFLCFLPLISFSQKIKSNEIDKFTKQKRIETSIETVKQAWGCGLGFWYRSVDTTYFLNIVGYTCGEKVIGSGDEVILLLSDSSTVKAISPKVQLPNEGRRTVSTNYSHQYLITKEAIEKLAKYNLESIRIYSAEVYEDAEIPKKDKLKELSKVFLAEISK